MPHASCAPGAVGERWPRPEHELGQGRGWQPAVPVGQVLGTADQASAPTQVNAMSSRSPSAGHPGTGLGQPGLSRKPVCDMPSGPKIRVAANSPRGTPETPCQGPLAAFVAVGGPSGLARREIGNVRSQ